MEVIVARELTARLSLHELTTSIIPLSFPMPFWSRVLVSQGLVPSYLVQPAVILLSSLRGAPWARVLWASPSAGWESKVSRNHGIFRRVRCGVRCIVRPK